MYAVIATGGKQYKVQKGSHLRVEYISGDVGSKVSFDKVLMFSDGEKVEIGKSDVVGAVVHGHIMNQGKNKKVIVFKYKRRKGYRRKHGHRQMYTEVMIDNLEIV